jgi:hypothetical protein
MPTGESNSRSQSQAFTYGLVIAFACLSMIGVTRHEMWRDELQAWSIARDSSSVVELYRNMRVEAHPMLWHSLLFLLTRFTDNPVTMQYVHWLIAVACVFLFVRYSPFTKFQKALFCFGYYPFYEYCLISRNYSLCMLFLFLFCLLIQRQPRNYIALAVVIGLLACSHFYDWAIALTLVAVLTADGVGNPEEREQLRRHRGTVTAAILIVVLLQGFAVLEAWNYFQAVPPGKSSEFQQPSMISSVLFAWRALFPIPVTNLNRFVWNSNFVTDGSPVGRTIATFISPLLVIPFLVVFWRRDRRAFILYALGTLLLWGGQLAIGFGALRHVGKHYVLLLASWWLASGVSPSEPTKGTGAPTTRWPEMLANGLLTAVLAVHFVAGWICYSVDFRQTFSAAKPAVQALVDRRLTDMPVAVSPDAFATSISAYLGKKVYAVDSERMQGFTSWDSSYYTQTNTSLEILQKTVRLLSGPTNRIFLITGGGDIAVQQDGKIVPIKQMIFETNFKISKLAQYSDTLTDERFWIYLVEKIPSAQSAHP